MSNPFFQGAVGVLEWRQRRALIVPNFPADWPEDCPPDDAKPAHGKVFRIVASAQIRENDLKSYEELDIEARGSECRRRAISVFESRAKACHRLRLSPRLGSAVAAAELRADYGEVKLTNVASGHVAWWCPVDLGPPERVKLFGEVETCP